MKKRTYIIVWVVDHWWLPLALVGRILDHGTSPLTTANRLTGWVCWKEKDGGGRERGKKSEGGKKGGVSYQCKLCKLLNL